MMDLEKTAMEREKLSRYISELKYGSGYVCGDTPMVFSKIKGKI